MAQVRLLDYSFIIDAVGSFTTISEFEKFFADFLESRGLLGEVISPLSGSLDRRVLFITKKPMEYVVEKNPVGRPQTLKGKIKELSDRKLRKPAIDFMKGNK